MSNEPAGLVGRAAELDELRRLLHGHRLVTLVGVGGVGKTRLAQAVVDTWPSRAAVCELDRLSSSGTEGRLEHPDAVADAVAGSLGYPSLKAATVGLAGSSRLLMLDGCEHQIDASAAVVERLLASCPELTVLATSREPLEVVGERLMKLGPLGLPASDDPEAVRNAPAVELFLRRAAASGGAAPDPAASPEIAELCRRLDGLPLAIELAAARTLSLTPAEILAHLGDRLDLLARRRDRGPARHQSLEAAIGWSYDRLPEETKLFFERLGVFAGRFTVESAHAVAAGPDDDLLAVLDHLDLLVAQSLITVVRRGDRSWYGLLSTVRAFARGQLAERGELDAAQDRWVDTLVDTATDLVNAGIRSASVDTWMRVHAAEDDLLAGLRWCLDHDEKPTRAATLFAPLWWIAYNARAECAVELGERVLERWSETSPEVATVAAITGFANVVMGDLDNGARLAQEALERAIDPLPAVVARRALSVHAHSTGRDSDALRWVDEAVAASRAGEMSAWHNELLTLRAFLLAAVGRTEEAINQAAEARDGADQIGSPIVHAWAALAYGCLLALRDPAAGRAVLEPLIERCHSIGYPLGAGRSLRALGALAFLEGQQFEAARRLGEGLDVLITVGHVTQVHSTLRWIAALLDELGRPEPAAMLRRCIGTAPSPISDVLERAHGDRLRVEPGGSEPAIGLRETVALARRELEAVRAAGAGTDVAPAVEVAAAPGSAAAPTEDDLANRFQREGQVWTLTFAGSSVRLPHAKGLADLATLIAHPGEEIHCTELMGAAVEQPTAGPAIDERARREYERRIIALQEELAEAEAFNDRGRAEKAQLELDLLVDQLAGARGLGGRQRQTGSTAERARSAVTWRIRSAIKRIAELHPELGEHLADSVRTGTWCSYQPQSPVTWRL